MSTLLDGSRLASVIDPDAELELLADGFWFTEGPAWNPVEESLVFSDIPADPPVPLERGGGRRGHRPPDAEGQRHGVRGGRLAARLRAGLQPSGAADRPTAIATSSRSTTTVSYLNSPNDVVVAIGDGSSWFTDPNYGRWPGDFGCERPCDLDFQGLFRVPAGGGDCELVVDPREFDQPNGLCFSPDESDPLRQRLAARRDQGVRRRRGRPPERRARADQGHRVR